MTLFLLMIWMAILVVSVLTLLMVGLIIGMIVRGLRVRSNTDPDRTRDDNNGDFMEEATKDEDTEAGERRAVDSSGQ